MQLIVRDSVIGAWNMEENATVEIPWQHHRPWPRSLIARLPAPATLTSTVELETVWRCTF